MHVYTNRLRTVSTKAKEVMSAPFRMVSAAMFSCMTALMSVAPTLCESVTINKSLDLDSLAGGMIGLIIKLAFYVGLVMAGGGVFSWLLAMKDDNSEGQSRGIRLIFIGGALMGLRLLLQLAGIIK